MGGDKSAWELAVEMMHTRDNTKEAPARQPVTIEPAGIDLALFEDDDLPTGLAVLSAAGTLRRSDSISNLHLPASSNGRSTSRKGKRKRHQSEPEEEEVYLSSADEDGLVNEEMVVADDTLVFAREKNTRLTVYWPARILQYIPPKRASGEGEYKVEYMDKIEAKIPRSLFYTEDEEEFYTCEVRLFDYPFCQGV